MECLQMMATYTTDTVSYAMGALRISMMRHITYDVKTEIYHYGNISITGMRQTVQKSRYAASAGAHFQGYRFLMLQLSRTAIDHPERHDTVATAFDSLWNIKDNCTCVFMKRHQSFSSS
jgi:hypothetical protein